MGRLLNIVTPLHKATARKYLDRMIDDKVNCMMKAKEYEYDYWDGDRRFGYGGYKYLPGRWKPVAQAFIDLYGLKPGARVLDVGCGKAYLLYEMDMTVAREFVPRRLEVAKHRNGPTGFVDLLMKKATTKFYWKAKYD